jgi:hypothetical protein
MLSTDTRRRSSAPAAVGILLVLAGIAVIALRQVGVDVLEEVGRAGWPFFVIVPGLVLLAMALVPAPPNGVGFAIAGSIVTTVGLILFYQQSTGHWDSWAYAWALIPGAAGLSMATYGVVSGHREFVRNGLWLGGVAAALFAAGFWFFESIFDSGRVPVDLATWWPAILIAAGLLVTLSAVGGSSHRELPADDAPRTGGDGS